jgi:hypothetical protein
VLRLDGPGARRRAAPPAALAGANASQLGEHEVTALSKYGGDDYFRGSDDEDDDENDYESDAESDEDED